MTSRKYLCVVKLLPHHCVIISQKYQELFHFLNIQPLFHFSPEWLSPLWC